MPTFVHSVSSYESQLRPEAAAHALRLFAPETLLVSAYDIENEPKDDVTKLIDHVEASRSAGSVVFLDSGNYEAWRKADLTWEPPRLHAAFARLPHDIAFCFDAFDPPQSSSEVVDCAVRSLERESKYTPRPLVPIIHAPRQADGSPRYELLPEILKEVSGALRPVLIAVPERDLGDGLLRRALTVTEIRSNLDQLGFYQPLHLLGTGNPISIAVLAEAGADSFDGLEWCRTVVDYQTARLHHFHHYDFFSWQAESADSPIVRSAISDPNIAFAGKVTFHNLEFFSRWMRDLREPLKEKRLEFLGRFLPPEGLGQLESAMPRVFKP